MHLHLFGYPVGISQLLITSKISGKSSQKGEQFLWTSSHGEVRQTDQSATLDIRNNLMSEKGRSEAKKIVTEFGRRNPFF